MEDSSKLTASNEFFRQRINQICGNHPASSKANRSSIETFSIRHYAQTVDYSIVRFALTQFAILYDSFLFFTQRMDS